MTPLHMEAQGWPHPKVRGQPSPTKRRDRHGKLSVSMERDPSQNAIISRASTFYVWREASSQGISSQILFLIGLERHSRATDANGDAANLLRLTQPPSQDLVECEIDPGALSYEKELAEPVCQFTKDLCMEMSARDRTRSMGRVRSPQGGGASG
ncbi:hypothetical protein QQF64_015349 [Cirrhinus molitorella]|uniref:Uncharacterized protein n=1 Tax=Cirrhinus molitorella TaxID=172907 RepID=A0ABR3NUZ9_9TELE